VLNYYTHASCVIMKQSYDICRIILTAYTYLSQNYITILHTANLPSINKYTYIHATVSIFHYFFGLLTLDIILLQYLRITCHAARSNILKHAHYYIVLGLTCQTRPSC
jgi:hypothetical protein